MSEKRPHSIVIVDDERVSTAHYRRALELDGYVVHYYDSVDELAPLLSPESAQRIDLFVIDIMLPPGTLYSNKMTDEGLYTGLFLAQDIRKTYPTQPIIILSNFTFPSIRAAASRLAPRLDNCLVLQKLDTPPVQLADIVNHYFAESELRSGKKRNVLKRLFDSLLLQPNISGVGLDLKKLGKDE